MFAPWLTERWPDPPHPGAHSNIDTLSGDTQTSEQGSSAQRSLLGFPEEHTPMSSGLGSGLLSAICPREGSSRSELILKPGLVFQGFRFFMVASPGLSAEVGQPRKDCKWDRDCIQGPSVPSWHFRSLSLVEPRCPLALLCTQPAVNQQGEGKLILILTQV